MSKKIRLLIEVALEQGVTSVSSSSTANDQPKSLQQLVLRNWATLAENSQIELERLKALRDATSEPSETEILRVAFTLGLAEAFVSGLPLKNGGKQPNGIT